MRPRGEIRLALGSAAAELGRGSTWRELATMASVGFDSARRTAENMCRAGEFVKVGHERVSGVCRPMALYAPAEPAGPGAGAALESVVRCWADFR